MLKGGELDVLVCHMDEDKTWMIKHNKKFQEFLAMCLEKAVKLEPTSHL